MSINKSASTVTSSALLGLLPPLRLAEVTAKGPTSSKSLSANGWAGTLTPTLPVPAVTASGSQGLAFTTMVRGPGQKALARASAASSNSPTSRCLPKGVCTGKGLSLGLLLASYIFSANSSLDAMP